MKDITDFEKSVKIALIEKGKDQKWLYEEVTKKTGLFFDRSYFYKTVTGTYENPNIISAISEILGIADEQNCKN